MKHYATIEGRRLSHLGFITICRRHGINGGRKITAREALERKAQQDERSAALLAKIIFIE